MPRIKTSKKHRTNLAALVAIVIVAALVSVPIVATALDGGTAPAYASARDKAG
jgi:hypothetical protein